MEPRSGLTKGPQSFRRCGTRFLASRDLNCGLGVSYGSKEVDLHRVTI